VKEKARRRSSSALPADSYVDGIRQRCRLLSACALADESLHRLTNHRSLGLRHVKFTENRFDDRIAADDPIQGFSNLMYTMHFYAATHKQWLRDRCDYALKKGLPLFISESAGMEATGDGPLNVDEWNKWIEWAEQRKVSWITWSVSDKNETCSVLLPTAGSEGKWKEADLKESGIKTREMIKKYGGEK